MSLIWHSIKLPPDEIYLDKLLRCGQAFRWVKNENIWSSTLNNRVVFLRQDGDQLEYASLASLKKNPFSITKIEPKLEDGTEDEMLGFISNYLNLQISIVQLYKDWASKDVHFAKVSGAFAGIRMLQQDPWETLISFICSSNNNVKRISKMCHALCLEYGDFIVEYAGTKYYSFPTPAQLASRASEASLRELGFGYRARYVYETSKMLADDKSLFMKLHSMRSSSFTDEQVHEFLLQFKGVGPKVADCVALMSLNRHSLVPIDTHVLQFARRDYSYKFRGRSNATLSSAMYIDMKRFFVEKWGDYAGWAHSVLFTRDLRLENR